MYNPIMLSSEHQLNKLLRQQKRTKEDVNILFYSLWDKWAQDLINALNSNQLDSSKKPKGVPKNLYLVNSFDMPHSTVIFRSTKLPHLVKVTKRGVLSEDYLPRIYRFLGLEASNKS